MLTIEQNIEEEQSLIRRKKVNRRTVFSTKNLTQKQDYQLPIRTKILRERSHHSIKQRSLDDADFKKAKLPSARSKNAQKPTKKKEKQPKPKGESTKSPVTAKLYQREVVRPTTKRSVGKSINYELEEPPRNRLGSSQGRVQTAQQQGRKQRKKTKSPIDKHCPSLPPTQPKSRIAEPSPDTTRFRSTLISDSDITLNDEVLRMFEATESKIVQEEELSAQDCESIERIYGVLQKLHGVVTQERTKLCSDLLELSNGLPLAARPFSVWKWLLLAVLLSERTIPEDEERQLNVNTLLTYVRMNFLLNVENLTEAGKSAAVRRLRTMLKRQTSEPDRCTKLAKNTDIIRSIASLILSGEPSVKALEALFAETDEPTFYRRFFEVWRERCLTPYLPPIRAGRCYTLCLDLDETLICFDRSNGKLLVRPFVSEFLERMAEHYELVVFTSSLKQYADFMIDQIDPKRLISYRLYRQNCTTVNNRQRKDLSKLGRPLSSTFLVDNLQDNYLLQPKSGLAVSSWYGDQNDRALVELATKLQRLASQG